MGDRAARWLVYVGMLALAVAVYWPAMHGAFIGDDLLLVRDNPVVRDASGWRQVWTSRQTPDYFPVTYLAWWGLWRVFGQHTTGYHAVNVFLHATSAYLIWRTLRAAGMRGGLLAGLLWMVHPLNVQSVAWIAELKNTLSMALFMGAMRCYVEPPRSKGWYIASLGLFLLALLSKTSVVMGAPVLVLYEWWRAGKLTRAGLLRTAPFFALSVALGLVTIWYQRHNAIGDIVVRTDSLVQRVLGAGYAVWFYVWKIAWPGGLSYVYPKHEGPLPGVLGWAGLIAVVALMWWARHTWGRHGLLGLGWFLLMLLPVLGFLDMALFLYTFVADHWAYVASVGLIALVAAWLANGRKITIGAALVAVLGCATWARAHVWRDAETLWRDTLVKVPEAWGVWNSVAMIELERKDYAAAQRDARQSLAISPANAEAYITLARALAESGDPAAAENIYRQGIDKSSPNAELKFNLANLLAARGALPEAEALYREILRKQPSHPTARANLGRVLEQEGKPAEAEQAYRDELAVNPSSVAARTNLANLLMGQGKLDEAARLVEGVDSARAINTLGAIRGIQGRIREAETLFRRALALDPQMAEAHSNLGDVLRMQGNRAAAEKEYRRALELRPDFAPALRGLSKLKDPPG